MKTKVDTTAETQIKVSKEKTEKILKLLNGLPHCIIKLTLENINDELINARAASIIKFNR